MLISMGMIILVYYTLQVFASGALAVMATMMTTMLTMLMIIILKIGCFHKWAIPPPPGCMYLCTNESTEMKGTWSRSHLFPRCARYECYTRGLRVMDDVNKGTGDVFIWNRHVHQHGWINGGWFHPCCRLVGAALHNNAAGLWAVEEPGSVFHGLVSVVHLEKNEATNWFFNVRLLGVVLWGTYRGHFSWARALSILHVCDAGWTFPGGE